MTARSYWNAKSTRKRLNKARRKYLPGVESLEALQLLSGIGDLFSALGSDIETYGQQAVNDIENLRPVGHRRNHQRRQEGHRCRPKLR